MFNEKKKKPALTLLAFLFCQFSLHFILLLHLFFYYYLGFYLELQIDVLTLISTQSTLNVNIINTDTIFFLLFFFDMDDFFLLRNHLTLHAFFYYVSSTFATFILISLRPFPSQPILFIQLSVNCILYRAHIFKLTY